MSSDDSPPEPDVLHPAVRQLSSSAVVLLVVASVVACITYESVLLLVRFVASDDRPTDPPSDRPTTASPARCFSTLLSDIHDILLLPSLPPQSPTWISKAAGGAGIRSRSRSRKEHKSKEPQRPGSGVHSVTRLISSPLVHVWPDGDGSCPATAHTTHFHANSSTACRSLSPRGFLPVPAGFLAS